MDCNNCETLFNQKSTAENLGDKDSENEKYYSLTIKSGTLARLIQRQHLTIADLHCMNIDTKLFIQNVLLQCILCKTVQNNTAFTFPDSTPLITKSTLVKCYAG